LEFCTEVSLSLLLSFSEIHGASRSSWNLGALVRVVEKILGIHFNAGFFFVDYLVMELYLVIELFDFKLFWLLLDFMNRGLKVARRTWIFGYWLRKN
jgi:hypothetical protein